jgi:hypothetical protein
MNRKEQTVKVRYTDGPDSLVIAAIGVEAKRGEAVEVPTEIGESLVEQGWSEVKSTSKPKKENN